MSERWRLLLQVWLMILVMALAGGLVVAHAGMPLSSLNGAEFPAVTPRPGAAPLLLGAFVAMCVLPLVPGLLEVLRPRDRYPLPVDLNYSKDPHYFGRSLRRLLRQALPAATVWPGSHAAKLSRPEQVRVTHAHAVAAAERVDEVLLVRGDLTVGADASLQREVCVEGRASLGPGSQLRAIACDGDLDLVERVQVLRWLDAEGDLRAGPDCRLGQHCSARGRLEIADGCRFARLFGAPIATEGGQARPAPVSLRPRIAPVGPDEDGARRTIDQVLRHERGDVRIDPGETVDSDLVATGNLAIGAGAVVRGSVHAVGGVDLAAGATVLGSVFADGPITVGEEATIAGHVFGQDTVTVARGVQIGRPGAVKSLIGNRGVALGGEVVVHGYVLTEGEGLVRCTAR